MIRRALHTLAVVGATFFVTRTSAAQQGRDESTFTWSRQMARGALLTIANGDGAISVREATGDLVVVRAVKNPRSRGSMRDVAFDVHETGDNVEICTLYGDRTSCRDRNNGNVDARVRVEYTVSIPRSLRVRAMTGNGEITIERAGADVTASTGNGSVHVGETQGRVNVSTGNGDIQVDAANGPVSANTGTGRVSVVTSRGSVNANTGTGDIDVHVKGGPIDGDMRFNSGSGSIHLALPSDFNGRIDATSGNGTLRSDFEISVVGRLNAQHVRGTIGRGGPLIRLSTGSGTIELKKN
jgi:DUF4097 and DUF4098 domain-containing protein YvlB